MTKLAIFDIDFTLTKRETLIQFYMFMLKKKPSLITHLPRSLGAFFLYSFRIYDEKRVKEVFLKFIAGIEEKEMELLVKEFYEKVLSKIFYEDAVAMIRNLKKEGCLVYLISASPEFYLKELYSINEVDKIIGTKIKLVDGRYHPEIIGLNNKGEEKVKRLMEVLQAQKLDIDWKNSYMFSDSVSDAPLFNLVGKPYLINYRRNHEKVEILRWR